MNLEEEIQKINSLSQVEMATLWRYAPSGHPYFDSHLPLFEIFNKRFKELGGFTPQISKLISQ